jgi:alkanesulfonate monooxygenase SsuD/methylene tetrahydromethanopterin reductase-like flavin-dependent oxidoreductase (luciferase family)
VKVSIFSTVPYIAPVEPPSDWPTPPGVFDPSIGRLAHAHAIEQAELADQLGFDWVSVAEHHYSANSLTPNPIVLAAALAPRVHRAKIALLGTTLPLANPVRVAEEFAMLDNLTDGRVIAGVLRGTPNEFLTYGTNPTESRDQYWEGIELMLRAWTEPLPFGWQGRHYQYRLVSIWPRPVQAPYPPVFMSGNSRESAVFAAQHRLSVGISYAPPPITAQLFQEYLAAARASGWCPTADNLLYRCWIHVAETDEQAAEEVRGCYWRRAQTSATAFKLQAGVLDALARSQPGKSGGSAVAAQNRAPVVQLCGSPATVLGQLRALHATTGVGVVDITFQGLGLPHDMVMHSLELFGTQVLPHIRDL